MISFSQKLINISLAVLILSFLAAVVYHFLFEEQFRPLISVIGQASLIGYFIGIIIVLFDGIKGWMAVHTKSLG